MSDVVFFKGRGASEITVNGFLGPAACGISAPNVGDTFVGFVSLSSHNKLVGEIFEKEKIAWEPFVFELNTQNPFTGGFVATSTDKVY